VTLQPFPERGRRGVALQINTAASRCAASCCVVELVVCHRVGNTSTLANPTAASSATVVAPDRAITSPRPRKARDIVDERHAIGRHPGCVLAHNATMCFSPDWCVTCGRRSAGISANARGTTSFNAVAPRLPPTTRILSGPERPAKRARRL
jgi:hypothetical protein